MADTVIRPLTEEDLDGALTLSSTAGWNQRLADWRMLLTIAPAGSFAAVDGARIVGTAMGIDYGEFEWIAMMLVDPAWRGRGLGRRLLEAAMAAVPAGRPIRLDATPLGRPLYESYGFRDEALLSRCVADAARRSQAAPDTAAGEAAIEPLEAVDAAILAQDRDAFRADRRAVLEWARGNAPHYARSVRRSPGGAQYCLGRQGRLFDQIGPVVASGDDAARALVDSALRAAGDRTVAIDVFDARTRFTAWLRGRGFRVERPLFRMCRQADGQRFEPRTRDGAAPSEFAIFGPEFG